MNKVLTGSEIEAAWGANYPTTEKQSLEQMEIPESLRALLPYAELWGVADDWAREDLLKLTPSLLKANLKWAVSKYDDLLDAWLAGPDASSVTPSDAYIAFSAMRMAADFA